MVQEVKSDHEELTERDKMVPGVDPEIMKPRKRNLSWLDQNSRGLPRGVF